MLSTLIAAAVALVALPALLAVLGQGVSWWAPGPLRRLHDRPGLGGGVAGSALR